MTPKQNALEIIGFGRPERLISGIPGHTICYHGCNHEGYAGGGHHLPVGSSWTDIWGTVWQREHEGVMGFPRGNPLAEVSALRTYPWPSPDDERLVSKVYELRKTWRADETVLMGVHRDTLWEKAYMLVGMDNMMEYFYTEPEFAREVLHRIMDFQMGLSKHYLACGIEMARCGDDLGTQRGPLLGPRIMREFLMPEYRRLMDLYRGRGVLISFHSCGCVEDVVNDFMELGIDILNPVQATANDQDRVRAATRGRMALEGGVSTASIMDGPVERIERETRRAMWRLGRDGGYVCCADQGLPFPPGHIEALKRTVEEHGQYPLEPVE
jgi:uroporphyrinogen decarboxylase